MIYVGKFDPRVDEYYQGELMVICDDDDCWSSILECLDDYIAWQVDEYDRGELMHSAGIRRGFKQQEFCWKDNFENPSFSKQKKIPKLFKRRSDKGGRGDNSSYGRLPPGSTKSLTP